MNRVFLLADDDSDDADLFREALDEVDPGIFFYHASNGQQALDILNDGALKQPQIIFLDLNMPVMDGWQCLNKLKSNSAFVHIPVFMYSTSSHLREVERAISLGAKCFFTKPHDFKDLKNILRLIADNLDGDLLKAVAGFNDIRSRKVFSCS